MRQRLQRLLLALGLVAPMLAAVPVRAAAVPTTFNFTQAELDANWGPERIAPSGGYSSVSYATRDEVVAINIDNENVNSNPYYRTEGIKTKKAPADNFSVAGDFGKSVSVDLYLDAAWDNTAVRAGLWTVGDNGSNGTDAANFPFGILEFANVSGYEGFRVFDSESLTGYVPVSGFTGYGNWVTLNITLDPDTNEYIYSINGNEVDRVSAPAVSTYLYSVMLNQRNFGLEEDDQTNLNEVDYTAHWHGGLVPAADTEDPTVPVALGASTPVVPCGGTTSSFSAVLDWSDSTDNSGTVAGYNYNVVTPNLPGGWTTQTNTSSYSGSFNSGEGTYTYRVNAYDAAGNVSGWSNSCSIRYDDPATVETFTSKDQCKDGGWVLDDRNFKNQGDCVSYFATRKNQPANATALRF